MSFKVKSVYFKLIGKKTYYFRLDSLQLDEIDSPSALALLYCFNETKPIVPGMLEEVKENIAKLMQRYSLELKELTEDEIKVIKLLYED